MRKQLLATTMICSLAAGGVFAQEASTDTDAAAETDLQQTAPAASDDSAVTEEMENSDTAEAEEPATEEMETETAESEDPAATDMETDTAEAEDPVAEAEDGTEVAQSDSVVREQASNELRLDWITGTNVKSPDGETIGDINDVIVDGETGELTAAVLSVGGFLGIGSKQIAVDWSKLTIDYDANEISSDLTREEADAAPEYAFRDQEQPPAPAMDTGTGMESGTGTDMGTGTTQLN